MKLYYSIGACSMSPRIVLNECAVEFTSEKVDLRSKKTESGADFFAINPKGYVPALKLNDGTLLTEGPAIVQYIADQNSKAGLVPDNGTIARYQLQSLLNFISTELHKNFGPLFNKEATQEAKKQASETLNKRFDYVAKFMEDRTYLTGTNFSVADAYLFTVLMWTKFVHFDLTPWPTLIQYLSRVAKRPAVVKSLEEENLLRFFSS